MLLSIDIGNSIIKFAVYTSPELHKAAGFHVASTPVKSADEYRLLIRQFLSEAELDGQIDASVIASVVPSLMTPIYHAVWEICGSKPFIIGAGTHTGFQINIDVHTQLGADIVANTAAARQICTSPAVIVDLGTATTFTALDINGNIAGTIIHPGLKISLDVLSRSAALLNDVSLTRPREWIGQNTAESMQSGIINGHICMIDGFLQHLQEMLCDSSNTLSCIATGGHAETVIPHCRKTISIDPDLTVRGAAILYYSNRKHV